GRNELGEPGVRRSEGALHVGGEKRAQRIRSQFRNGHHGGKSGDVDPSRIPDQGRPRVKLAEHGGRPCPRISRRCCNRTSCRSIRRPSTISPPAARRGGIGPVSSFRKPQSGYPEPMTSV